MAACSFVEPLRAFTVLRTCFIHLQNRVASVGRTIYLIDILFYRSHSEDAAADAD